MSLLDTTGRREIGTTNSSEGVYYTPSHTVHTVGTVGTVGTMPRPRDRLLIGLYFELY